LAKTSTELFTDVEPLLKIRTSVKSL
jgi:hypothetical protein